MHTTHIRLACTGTSSITFPHANVTGTCIVFLDLPVHVSCVAGTAAAVVSAPPPPSEPGSLYFEAVEAVLGEGLRFLGGGQVVRFGDSAQVRYFVTRGMNK